ncbi:hypothetical protein BFP97_01425 [Roseivirga sp. 4D4]|nr:hypothetical protein BFP97_01425 [Roseivirga sp. 4D4]
MILIGIFFIILGALIKYARMHHLIAGYSTMSAEEQAKYDIEGIASVLRNGFFGMAVLVVLIPLIPLGLDKSTSDFVSIMISVFIGVTYILIRVNSKQFRKKE